MDGITTVLYLFLLPGTGAASYSGVTVPCEHYEVFECGSVDNEWSICSPETLGVTRIVSAQLDTRYTNRYCRRYGMPENFGLTRSGRAMWTVGWCHGTFFLCLEIDPFYILNDFYNLTAVTSSTISSTSILSNTLYTEARLSVKDDLQESDEFVDNTEETDNLESEEYLVIEKGFESETIGTSYDASSNKTEQHTDGHSRQTHTLDSKLKFWLIFGIISGGIIIIILICVITYLVVQRNDMNEEYSPSKKSHEKYFRQQKWSTSALVTSESDYCTDVYDFIPTDRSQRRKVKCSKSIVVDTNNDKIESNEINEASEISSANEKNVIEQTYAAVSMARNNSCKGDYFILIPHDLNPNSLDTDNNNVKIYSHTTEDLYDHLVNSPAKCVSDDTTYSRLDFKGETV